MTSSYKTIQEPVRDLFKEKASKFHALAYPVSSEEEVKEILDAVKKEFYDSRHVCYAYVLGAGKEIFRVNDAGEPSNTAGKPILGQITAFDLTNVLVIVVRYFGGTKLGVGGLIQAYKTSAQMVLGKSHIIEKNVTKRFVVESTYENLSLILKSIKSAKGNIIANEQTELCKVTCEIPVLCVEQFKNEVSLKILSLK
ncbi:MAG TPA: YigZ family protein [Flavobacteriales bacterium]|nr:YigZ family protein [Flavobacteriales bacterium]